MGKSKPAKSSATPVVAKPVKEGRVTKSSQTPKSKSKEVAKAVASKKLNKKIVTPESDDDSEDDSDSDSSNDSSEDDSEEEVAPKKNGVNGVKAVNGAHADSDSSSDDSSDDDSDAAPPKAAAKTNGAADSDSSDDSDSDSDAPATEKTAPATNGVKSKAKKVQADSDSSDSDSDDDSDDSADEKAAPAKKAAADSSDSDSDSDEEEEKVEAAAKKRKADDESPYAAKKAKLEAETAESGPNGESKNLFIGNLSWNVDDNALYAEFQDFGAISGVRIVYDRDSGRSRGFGYVEFEKLSDAIAAHDAKAGALVDGREMNVDYSQGKPQNRNNQGGDSRAGFAKDRAKKYGDSESPPSDTLFVGNISFDVTPDLVRETFQEYGYISRISLPTDRETGAPKGFGYVGFGSVDEAKAAMEALNGADIGGRSIRLDYAQPRADNGDSPRGGGRGGGRGGFRGGRGGGGGGFGGRGGGGGGFRGGARGGRGGGGRGGFTTNRGGFGDFSGKKVTF